MNEISSAERAGSGRAVVALFLGAVLAGCTGPRPLEEVMSATDDQAYAQLLAPAAAGREAFWTMRSIESGRSPAELRAADAGISEHSNPFDTSDPRAVSAGAVVYRHHCATCHGENADGRGPAMPVYLSKMDFHGHGKQIKRWMPGTAAEWFASISNGMTSRTVGPQGQPLVMPPFRDSLAREQIWLAITYLLSR